MNNCIKMLVYPLHFHQQLIKFIFLKHNERLYTQITNQTTVYVLVFTNM